MFACIAIQWSSGREVRTSFHKDLESAYKHGIAYAGVYAIELIGAGYL